MSHSLVSPLSIRFRGVRGSIPSAGRDTSRYGGNTSCLEVRAGNDLLILDAGSGIRQLGRDLGNEFGARPIAASLLITHTHWDHIQGLPFFAPGFIERNQIRVLAPFGRGRSLERALHNQMQPLHFPVGLETMRGLRPVEELSSDQTRLGAFQINVTNLNHPGGCAGFRVEANGASFAYLPDHEPFSSVTASDRAGEVRNNALIEFVRGVDLLILDTQYTATEYPSRIGWGHGCLPDSVALAVAAQVRELALFHHDPAHDDDQVDAMVAEARRLVAGNALVITGAVENSCTVIENSIGAKRTAPLLDSAAA